MFIALVIVHVLVAVGLIFVVLLQSGRGAELGAAFGGMGQATFGHTKSTFITKFTTGMAVVFMATSLTLAFLSIEHPASSVVTGAGPEPARTEAAAPATATPAAPVPATNAPTSPPAAPAVPPLQQSDVPTAAPLKQTDVPTAAPLRQSDVPAAPAKSAKATK